MGIVEDFYIRTYNNDFKKEYAEIIAYKRAFVLLRFTSKMAILMLIYC
jgi:hypothetical protein